METLSYIRAQIEQWERGIADPEDVVREIRKALNEDAAIEAQERREADAGVAFARTDSELLRERKRAWDAFTAAGGRGVEEADYIDALDAEIEQRGL